MAHAYFTFAVVAMLVMSQDVSAKRGCKAFGHSCYGGHGKRSASSVINSYDAAKSEMMERRQLGQEEIPLHPGYPQNDFGILSPADDMIPVRDGGLYDRDVRDDAATRAVMKLRLGNIFKNWMNQYRRSQQTEDGYNLESL